MSTWAFAPTATAYRPKPTTIKLPPFTLLACTTDAYQLIEPLRERFRLIHRLSPYSPEDTPDESEKHPLSHAAIPLDLGI